MRIISNLPNPTGPTTERPAGALKDVSAPAAGDGTPARADWLNDGYYALLAVMFSVGITADDSDEEVEAGTGSSQFLSAMRLFAQEWAYPGQDQGLKDISAGNQTTDITAFEVGGGSEKEDGFTVRMRWTGGDASFNHQPVSAYTMGNEMTGFVAAALWKGEGAGELVARLDKTNSQWIVLTPGVWDSGNNANGFWEKYNNGSQECRIELNVGTATTITWAIPFIDVAYRLTHGILNTVASDSFNLSFIIGTILVGSIDANIRRSTNGADSSSDVDVTAKGRWVA